MANAIILGDFTTVLGGGTAGFTFSGPVSGAGGLRKQGSCGLTLSGSNSFAGAPVTVEGGTLAMGNLNALAGAGSIYVESGGQLNANVNGVYANVPASLKGTGAGVGNSGGALRFNVNTASVTWPGSLNLSSDSQITFFSAGGGYTFSAPITGTGDVQFRGGGAAANHYQTVILAGASTYTGNTTAFGDAANITLQLSGGADRLPTTTTVILAGDLFNSTALRGWLDLNGNKQTLAGLTTASGGRGTGDNRVVNSATTTNATLTINNAVSSTFAGALGAGNGDSRNNFNLSKTGAGTLTLSGVNTYTGYTSVTGGTLALSAAANNLAGSTFIDVGSGATLDVSGITGGCTLGTGQTLSGIGNLAGAITLAGSHQPGVGGTQSFGDGLTYAATGRRVWRLLGNVTTGAGASFDQVAVTGTAVIKSGAAINVNLAAPGSQVNLTNAFWTLPHTWTVLTAGSLNGTFAIGPAGNDLAGNPAAYYGAFSITQTATAVSVVWTPFKPFVVWQNVHFGASASDPAIAGSAASPANDGIANLLKYALGLDPNVPSVAGLPSTDLTAGHLQMQFVRNTAATDIVYQVQASNDLLAWRNIATLGAGATAWTTSGSTVTDNNGQVSVTDSTASTSTNRRVLRLQVIQP